ENPFRGIFNGNGHTIANLKIYSVNPGYGTMPAGIFSTTDSAIVTNLRLENIAVTTEDESAGALAGQMKDTQLDSIDLYKVAVQTADTNTAGVGSLAGSYHWENLTKGTTVVSNISYESVEVQRPEKFSGGLIGKAFSTVETEAGEFQNIYM